MGTVSTPQSDPLPVGNVQLHLQIPVFREKEGKVHIAGIILLAYFAKKELDFFFNLQDNIVA